MHAICIETDRARAESTNLNDDDVGGNDAYFAANGVQVKDVGEDLGEDNRTHNFTSSQETRSQSSRRPPLNSTCNKIPLEDSIQSHTPLRNSLTNTANLEIPFSDAYIPPECQGNQILPNMDEIYSTHIPTIVHPPKVIKTQFSKIIHTVYQEMASEDIDVKTFAFHKHAMIFKSVLFSSRGN